jgi:hypothetical protein
MRAKACKCRGDSVNINMDDFLANLKSRNRSPKSPIITKVKKEKTHLFFKCENCDKLRKCPKSKMPFNLLEFLLPKNQSFTCCLLKKLTCEEPEEKKRKYSKLNNKTKPKKLPKKTKNTYQYEKLQSSTLKSKKKKTKSITKRRYSVKVRG